MNREYQLENEEFRRKRAEREQEEFNKARKAYIKSISRKKKPKSLNLPENDILGLGFEDYRVEKAWTNKHLTPREQWLEEMGDRRA